MTNIYNLFKFLNDKEGKKIPLKVKLILSPETLTPEDLDVEGYLNLHRTKITSLPQGLQVGGLLDLRKTKITSLPQDLQVGGFLDLRQTPLSKKYSKEEIRKMVPGVKGEIYI
jgi:hypothetical protein